MANSKKVEILINFSELWIWGINMTYVWREQKTVDPHDCLHCLLEVDYFYWQLAEKLDRP